AALDWPYQAVVGGSRQAFDLPGSEVVVGAYQTAPMRLGAAVAVVPVGKGRVVLSTLDLVGQLERSVTPAAVARRLVANYLAFAAGSSRPIRILPIGDSITEGNAELGSYRLQLAEMLKEAGVAFEYVGSRTTQGGLGHEAYSGNNAEFVAKKVAEHAAGNVPDIALIHAGHNYFAENAPVPKIIAATERMIASLRAANPRVTVLVAQVIPSAKLPKYSYIPELNAELARVAPGWSTPESRVLVVDQFTGFDPVEDTVADLVHPNARGIEKLARRWFEALERHLHDSPPAR
nr:SGNH/GDSL hydrolase family protein [Opitutaceae bacterium]